MPHHHFLLEWTYTAPIEQIEAATPDHRDYLQSGVDRGILLVSGPKVPREGGILLIRVESPEAAEAFAHGDPFFTRGLARPRLVEFRPVKRQAVLDEWVD